MIINLLILTLLIPVFGFLGVSCINKNNTNNIKDVSIWTTSFSFFLTLLMAFSVKDNVALDAFFISLVISKTSIYFIALASFIILAASLIGRAEIIQCVKTFYLSAIGLEVILFFLFLSNNVVIFYILLSIATLIIFLLARIFVSEYATKFFILQTVGMLTILFGITYTINVTGLTEISALTKCSLTILQERIIFWTLIFGLLIQSATFPMHLYTAEITSEAPSALSVLISGIYNRISTFCILSIVLQIVPHACASYQMVMFFICSVAIICCTISMLFLQNLKQVVAHIDVTCSAIIIFGAFILNTAGATGTLICMGAYSLTISALFYFTYILEKYCGNCMTKISSVVHRTPVIALLAEIPILSIAAVPLLPCFIGEFTILSACFNEHSIACCFFGALFLIFNFFAFVIFQKIIFGEKTEQAVTEKYDIFVMGVFVLLILAFGIGFSVSSKFITTAIDAMPIKEIYKNVSL